PFEGTSIMAIYLCGARLELSLGKQCAARLPCVVAIIVVVGLLEQVGIIIVGDTSIEKLGILRSDRQRQILVNGVEVDAIPQDVALDRLKESLAAALKALEQVGPAKAHEPLAGPRQVLDGLRLGLSR